MPVELVPESDLRAALRLHQVDAAEFEASIRARIEAGIIPLQDESQKIDDPLLTVAATFIPWPLITGGKITGGGAKFSSLTLGQKLLGYAALPAISLFLLVGVTFFSSRKIHKVQKENQSDISDARELQAAVRQWWKSHKLAAATVFAAILILPMIGSTWLLFLLLLGSFGLLLYFLTSFAKIGVGNRLIVAQSCLLGLGFLGQTMANPFAGKRDIHFVDQVLISVVFYLGTLILVPILVSCKKRVGSSSTTCESATSTYASQFVTRYPRLWGFLYFFIVISMLVWFTNPVLIPATPTRILQHVESFEKGRYPSITFRNWEIPASWTIEQGLHPDLIRARWVLNNQITTDQELLTVILGSAFRVGLVRTDQIDTLPDLEQKRNSLLPEASSRKPDRITSLNQYAWVFYALDQSDQLSLEDRDFLEQRLLVTLENPVVKTSDMLETALRVTQLLEVIDRPIDRDKYRKPVHDWLREFHSKQTHFYQIAGGFEQYKDSSASMQATSHAIELMQIYGVPEDLDLNWVRSFLRPLYFRPSSDKWIAAVTLDRLNNLPGVSQPTLFEWLYYERSLLAAMLLVVLCVYATLSSPLPPVEPKELKASETD